MQYPKLQLHIAQVERLIAASRSKFSDKKKEVIYNNLLDLFDKVKNSNYPNFTSENLAFAKIGLHIVFYGVEFLDYKYENEIPKRLIFCLNKVLDEWITHGTDKYFIVVSYNNTADNFFNRAFDQEYLNGLIPLLKTLFDADYSQSLIQISKPRFVSNDYLSSIPVYHELGHFIDKNYQIVKTFSREKEFHVHGISSVHFGEFFADLFAAQYLGKTAIVPLDETRTTSAPTHPSNSKRVEVVNTFVEGTGPSDCMSIVSELKRVTLIRTGRELNIRYQSLEDAENPFITLTPKIFSSPEKLHSLFNAGWQSWLDPRSVLRAKYPQHADCSRTINKLIQNSIKLNMQQGEYRKLKQIGNFLENMASRYGIMGN